MTYIPKTTGKILAYFRKRNARAGRVKSEAKTAAARRNAARSAEVRRQRKELDANEHHDQ
jgi:hypothetical protein